MVALWEQSTLIGDGTHPAVSWHPRASVARVPSSWWEKTEGQRSALLKWLAQAVWYHYSDYDFIGNSPSGQSLFLHQLKERNSPLTNKYCCYLTRSFCTVHIYGTTFSGRNQGLIILRLVKVLFWSSDNLKVINIAMIMVCDCMGVVLHHHLTGYVSLYNQHKQLHLHIYCIYHCSFICKIVYYYKLLF